LGEADKGVLTVHGPESWGVSTVDLTEEVLARIFVGLGLGLCLVFVRLSKLC